MVFGLSEGEGLLIMMVKGEWEGGEKVKGE
jgi:hypothetical protein